MTLVAGSRVLVVGAGIAGLPTARALARSGFWPEIIEREPASPAGTGARRFALHRLQRDLRRVDPRPPS